MGEETSLRLHRWIAGWVGAGGCSRRRSLLWLFQAHDTFAFGARCCGGCLVLPGGGGGRRRRGGGGTGLTGFLVSGWWLREKLVGLRGRRNGGRLGNGRCSASSVPLCRSRLLGRLLAPWMWSSLWPGRRCLLRFLLRVEAFASQSEAGPGQSQAGRFNGRARTTCLWRGVHVVGGFVEV